MLRVSSSQREQLIEEVCTQEWVSRLKTGKITKINSMDSLHKKVVGDLILDHGAGGMKLTLEHNTTA